MFDIFISYAREDIERANRLANALSAHGWSVFWDRTIPPGKTWREVIGTALEQARCIVVLWSNSSIRSNWVQEEADEGLRRGILVPALIEDVIPPIGFRSVQAANLLNWKGSSPDFHTFLMEVSQRLTTPSLPERRTGTFVILNRLLENVKSHRVVLISAAAISIVAAVITTVPFPKLIDRVVLSSAAPSKSWEAIGGEWSGPDEKGMIRGASQDYDAFYLYRDVFRDFIFSSNIQIKYREGSLAFQMSSDAQNGYLLICIPDGIVDLHPGFYLSKRVNNINYYVKFDNRRHLSLEQWFRLSVQTRNSRILVSLDDTILFDYVDEVSPYFSEGRLGFRLYGVPDYRAAAAYSNIKLPTDH